MRSTLAQLASVASCWAWVCHCPTSTRSASTADWASRHGLVESTSMRCASSTAASRCTCTWRCRSSITRTRSTKRVFNVAKGSLLKGAPAFAASRCQAKASAIFSLAMPSRLSALAAHSAANTSCPLARLASSSFSRTSLAAPLSFTLNSLNTSANASAVGLLCSQSRTRAARSPEVGAEKAPPVKLSNWARSFLLTMEVDVTAGSKLG